MVEEVMDVFRRSDAVPIIDDVIALGVIFIDFPIATSPDGFIADHRGIRIILSESGIPNLLFREFLSRRRRGTGRAIA